MGRTWGANKAVRWTTGGLLLVATAFTHPSHVGSPDRTPQVDTRNSLAESEIQVANPFATPWLLSDPLAQKTEPRAAGSTPVAEIKPFEKAKYRLEPDPFEPDLPLGSISELDARSALGSRPPEIDTAQRLATAQGTKLPRVNPHTT